MQNTRKLCTREGTSEVISPNSKNLIDYDIWCIDWKVGNQAIVEYSSSTGDAGGPCNKLEDYHVIRT